MRLRPARAIVRLLILVTGTGIAACDRGGERPRPWLATAPDPAGSSLVLVTLDTFRASALGAAGSPRARTPHLDRLARTGLQFETGVAVSPITLPSHASILTGLDPPAHGVRNNGMYRLGDDIPTVAADLADRGFTTGAFVAGAPLIRRFGLARGFVHYDDAFFGGGPDGIYRTPERPGDEVVASALEWMTTLPAGDRLFAWVHLFDPHAPYAPPPPLAAASGGDAYLGEIAATDRYVGRLARWISRERPSTWMLIVGDHGESLGDHGEDSHAVLVYDATIRTPALVWPAPGGAPELRRAAFRQVDSPATMYELLGLPTGEAPGEGASALRGDARLAYVESLAGYLHHGWAPLHGLRGERWKLIRGVEPELYDLLVDPGERNDLADAHPEVVEELTRKLDDVLGAGTRKSQVDLDDDAKAALESLGYATTRVTRPDLELPDPRRMLRIQRLINAATESMSGQRYEEASRTLRVALSHDPRNKEVYKTLGRLHTALGQPERAIEYLTRCLELPPETTDQSARTELANAYLQLQRFEEAERQYELVLAATPHDPDAWYNLGILRVSQGRTAEAEAAWRQVLQLDPVHAGARDALRRIGASPQKDD